VRLTKHNEIQEENFTLSEIEGTPVSHSKNMYTPEHKSKLYLLLVLAVASLIGWAVFVRYRPMLVETSCSEVAANSSDILGKRYSINNNDFSYETVKRECLNEFK